MDPAVFQIENGKLILQNNKKAYEKFNADLPGNIKLADANWPGLVQKNGSSMKVLVNVDSAGVAIQGYDPVAYFKDNKLEQGDPKIEASLNGALYHFVSEDNRATFENDPTKYAPQYGGYCGYAASINKLAPIDPAVFQIVDGRLVLQYSMKTYGYFKDDLKASVAKANTNWPTLVEKNGK